MQGSRKIPINDLNQHITCKICNGYFIDATTIIECLHTFCRSCIVKYLENNRYCPVCDVQVHKTKPLLNIRPDKTIQDIVYKLVPRLFHNETQRRKVFYESHPESKPSSLEVSGEAAYQYLLTPEETVCLTLSYHGSSNTMRYLRCPAAVSLGHLKKLIRAKYDLTENHRVEILHNQDCLGSSLTLMDVAYIYLWKRKGPIELTYRIYECSAKKLKLEPDQGPESAPVNNNNWKEVQLRISESGEMSITGIQDASLSPSILEIVDGDQQQFKNEVVTVVDAKPKPPPAQPKKELPGLKYIGKNGSASPPKAVNDTSAVPATSNDVLRLETGSFPSGCATLSSATTTTVFSTINSTKCSTKSEEVVVREEPPKPEPLEVPAEKAVLKEESPMVNNVSDKSLKRKNDGSAEAEPPIKQAKPTVLNHSLGLLNLSNNHPLKKHSKLNRNGESIKEIVLRNNAPATESTPATTAVLKTVPAPAKASLTTVSVDGFPKPNPPNKNLTVTQPCRPGTPLVVPKPSVAPSKQPVVHAKPPISVFAVKSPCYMPKTTYNPVVSVLKTASGAGAVKNDSKPPNAVKNEAKAASGSSTGRNDAKPCNAASSQLPQQQVVNLNNKMGAKGKPSSPIGYKTLRDPPKSWNSQISKANLNKPPSDPKYSELKGVRPAKFFKMRNNMPRYLGNPASGVKPMYQVHVSPEKEKAQETGRTEKSEIRKHSIVKIDPKTLKPISEKAPETTSLSNHSSGNQASSNHHHLGGQTSQSLGNSHLGGQSLCSPGLGQPTQNDLKINTSSVSIFNPLKLQSSPKNERRSPKSPHSPKLKAQATGSPTGSKRDKVNLNFTPPNPFVPNLASPTISPNQFLYPAGPPGFPPYDPRMMAAYHSLWYGQRMGFPASPIPRLSLDLNQQRKNFEMMPSPTSPKMAASSQQGHSPQISTKVATTTSSASSASKSQNVTTSTAPKPSPAPKKAPKDSKGEKSLETTVEKLTQNRNKEMSSRIDQSQGEKDKAKRPDVPEKPEPKADAPVVEQDASPPKTSSSSSPSLAVTTSSSQAGGSSSSATATVASDACDKQQAEAKPSEKPGEAASQAPKSDVCADTEGEVKAASGPSPERSEEAAGKEEEAKRGDEVVEGGK